EFVAGVGRHIRPPAVLLEGVVRREAASIDDLGGREVVVVVETCHRVATGILDRRDTLLGEVISGVVVHCDPAGGEGIWVDGDVADRAVEVVVGGSARSARYVERI